MNRPSQFPPLTAAHVASRRLRSVPVIPNLRSVTRDEGAAELLPAEIARRADNVRRTEQATRIARVANDRFAGPPRQYSIEPRIDWPTVLVWWALALSVGIFIYFGCQMVRAAIGGAL